MANIQPVQRGSIFVFKLFFDDKNNVFEITNLETGKTARIPEPRHFLVQPGEVVPDLVFGDHGDCITYTHLVDRNIFDRKEIGLYSQKQGWACIVRVKPETFWLKENDGSNRFYLVGKYIGIPHNFAHNRIDMENISLEFHDLESGQQVKFETCLIREPDVDWFIKILNPEVEGEPVIRSRDRLDKKLERWRADHARLSTSSKQHQERSINFYCGLGYMKAFRPENIRDGRVLEIWDCTFDEVWSSRFDHYNDAQLLDVKRKIDVYKRADIDAPLHQGHGVDVYLIPGGLQIEDTVRREKFYYLEEIQRLIRASWNWEVLPIEFLHDQIQVFDAEYPGHMPRVKKNCLSGCDDDALSMKDLCQALRELDYARISQLLGCRQDVLMDRRRNNEERHEWAPFPEPSGPTVAQMRARTIRPFEVAGNPSSPVPLFQQLLLAPAAP
jgi:hypothetical protein